MTDDMPESNEVSGSILILGNSHVHMFRRSSDPQFAIHWINFGIGASAKHGTVSLDEGIELAKESELVAISLLGTAHNIFGLIKHEQPFDIMLPDDTDTPKNATLIPYNSLFDSFLQMMRENEPVRKIVEAATCPVVHLSPPPPKKEIVWRNPAHVLDEAVLNPAARRLRLWKIELDAMQSHCSDLDIHLLMPPHGTQTDEDFLDPYYAAPDAVHANPRYGHSVLKQLSDFAALSRA